MSRALLLIASLLLSGFTTRAQTATDIRVVDFGNFTYRIDNSKGKECFLCC